MAPADPSSKPSDPQTDKWMNAVANFLDFDRQGRHTDLTYRREGSRAKNHLWLSEQLEALDKLLTSNTVCKLQQPEECKIQKKI